jgi:NADPH:quinone reductase-like Zn-dependent oxidoreductase
MSNKIVGYTLRVQAKADGIDALQLQCVDQPAPKPAAGEVLVEVQAAAINPSDVKATLGYMAHAVFPRTPGRDYAGVVLDGPSALLGMKVWGSGGDLGIIRDGSHARYLLLPESAIRACPSGITLDEAGAVGVPFVSASEGFARCGGVQAGQTVVVFGSNGKVGQAAVQIAARAGAKVFAVQRKDALEGFASQPVQVVNSTTCDPAARILELTSGRGADLVFNTVDRVYWEAGHAVMAKRATQIFIIATKGQTVPLDLFRFYRNMHNFVGIDSLALDSTHCGALLEGLRPGFEDGSLRPYPVLPANQLGLAQAMAGYRRVFAGAQERFVLKPAA